MVLIFCSNGAVGVGSGNDVTAGSLNAVVTEQAYPVQTTAGVCCLQLRGELQPMGSPFCFHGTWE